MTTTIIQDVEPRYHMTREAAFCKFNSDPCKLWVRKSSAPNCIKPYATGDLPGSRTDHYSLIGENGYPAALHEDRIYRGEESTTLEGFIRWCWRCFPDNAHMLTTFRPRPRRGQ